MISRVVVARSSVGGFFWRRGINEVMSGNDWWLRFYLACELGQFQMPHMIELARRFLSLEVEREKQIIQMQSFSLYS